MLDASQCSCRRPAISNLRALSLYDNRCCAWHTPSQLACAAATAPQALSCSQSRMVLGEAYLKDILRPPPVSHVPDNVAHPFQKSFWTYLTKRAIPKHWYLAAGFTFTLTLYGTLDSLRDAGKKKAYDAAVLEGRQPYTAGGH